MKKAVIFDIDTAYENDLHVRAMWHKQATATS